MMLIVQKYPAHDPSSLAICRETDNPAAIAPDGWELMSVEAYTAWRDAELAAGWTPAPPPEVNVIPQEVTPRQFQLALLQHGISPGLIRGALAGDEAALIEWDKALSVRRDHPLVGSMAAMLGKSEAEVDAIFQTAATL